jgi:hypothetical protein
MRSKQSSGSPGECEELRPGQNSYIGKPIFLMIQTSRGIAETFASSDALAPDGVTQRAASPLGLALNHGLNVVGRSPSLQY